MYIAIYYCSNAFLEFHASLELQPDCCSHEILYVRIRTGIAFDRSNPPNYMPHIIIVF